MGASLKILPDSSFLKDKPVRGCVIACLPAGRFRVQLEDGRIVTAIPSRKMRCIHLRVRIGTELFVRVSSSSSQKDLPGILLMNEDIPMGYAKYHSRGVHRYKRSKKERLIQMEQKKRTYLKQKAG